MDYTKWYDKDIKVRFWAKVQKYGEDECWIWHGAMNQNGKNIPYSQAQFKSHLGGLASRFSNWLEHGDFDWTLCVCHTCDNPRCMNPKHLFLATQQENLLDCGRKRRHHMQKGEVKSTSIS